MSPLPFIQLKPNAKGRVLSGHPWVFANEVAELLPASHNGQVVECRDRKGRALGSGIFNANSQIVWRSLGPREVSLDEALLRERLHAAIDRRDALGLADYRRLIWSESDGLPGIVLDQFGDTLVLQVQTLAMEPWRDFMAETAAARVRATEVIHRNDSRMRQFEGLPSEVSTQSGVPWQPRWATIAGMDYWLELMSGQKTGFYLDQREQHHRVADQVRRLVATRPRVAVLDAFCNQGAFALHAARAGATEVRGLDSAEDAIAQAKMNATRNGVDASFEVANVFDWFTANREQRWDLVVLDPPPFAKSKKALTGALRGYKELNLRALRGLNPGGVLATYTCSHHMGDTELRGVIAEAAHDARRTVHILEHCHQPADHPVLVTMPESEYLRGYILQVE